MGRLAITNDVEYESSGKAILNARRNEELMLKFLLLLTLKLNSFRHISLIPFIFRTTGEETTLVENPTYDLTVNHSDMTRKGER